MLIFEISSSGRLAHLQLPELEDQEISHQISDIPAHFLRTDKPNLPEVSELQVVRHYTDLSTKNFSIDTQFYPLGSCTMKYNPKGIQALALLPGFLFHHPLSSLKTSQGTMQIAFELQEYLKTITGMQGVSLTPMAGAQGELAGVLMIKAYHHSRGDNARTEMLVPDSAHGTNPASAVMCGYQVKEISTNANGDLDLDSLKRSLGPKTAGIMLTNPSTLGLFERQIEEVEKLVHDAGGLLYYDGANLNAILGRVRPGDMGFDVMHMNLHKTFATPHGGGGPGAGPVAVNERLLPFLPIPTVGKNEQGFFWQTEKECPQTIGRLSTFMGNAAINIRAYIYIRMLGRRGLSRVSEYAVLNANYLMKKLEALGFTLAYPKRRAAHEFLITFKSEAKAYGVTAMDFAKRILDFGCHAPTTYFPLIVPECWLIEPTETESKEELDRFLEIMQIMREEMIHTPEKLKQAPHTLPVRRLDDVKAARILDVTYTHSE